MWRDIHASKGAPADHPCGERRSSPRAGRRAPWRRSSVTTALRKRVLRRQEPPRQRLARAFWRGRLVECVRLNAPSGTSSPPSPIAMRPGAVTHRRICPIRRIRDAPRSRRAGQPPGNYEEPRICARPGRWRRAVAMGKASSSLDCGELSWRSYEPAQLQPLVDPHEEQAKHDPARCMTLPQE